MDGKLILGAIVSILLIVVSIIIGFTFLPTVATAPFDVTEQFGFSQRFTNNNSAYQLLSVTPPVVSGSEVVTGTYFNGTAEILSRGADYVIAYGIANVSINRTNLSAIHGGWNITGLSTKAGYLNDSSQRTLAKTNTILYIMALFAVAAVGIIGLVYALYKGMQ